MGRSDLWRDAMCPEDKADEAAEACPACGGSGYERALGRDNDEIVLACSECGFTPTPRTRAFMKSDPSVLRARAEALAEAWEAHAQHPACRGERGSGIRSCIDDLRSALAAPETPDPDARVKKGFRIGIEAAAKWIEGQATAPHFTEQLRYTLAEAIRSLASEPESAPRDPCPSCGWQAQHGHAPLCEETP